MGGAPTPMAREGALDRAMQLGARGDAQGAERAFLAALETNPSDPAVLLAFGAWLFQERKVGAAQVVLERLVQVCPESARAQHQLALCLHARQRRDAARSGYVRALELDPGLAEAHLGLAALLEEDGNARAAETHWRAGFDLRPVLEHRAPARDAPRLLVTSTTGAGNTPTSPIIDLTRWSVAVVVPDRVPAALALPSHDLAFNAISDADLAAPSLERATAFLMRSPAPVVNAPARLRETGREAMARRLRTVDDVRAARVERWRAVDLIRADARRALAARGWRLPLLLRTLGAHGGEGFLPVATAEALAPSVRRLGRDELLVVEDLRAPGARIHRKLRWVLVDGRWHPWHLALSRDWKVHYFSSDMAARASYREREAAFLATPEATMGARAMRALEALAPLLPFDFGAVDCDVDADGRLVVFEANATVAVPTPGGDVMWDYRRKAHAAILAAVEGMLRRRLPTA